MTSARHRCFSLLMAKDQFTSPMTSHYDSSDKPVRIERQTCTFEVLKGIFYTRKQFPLMLAFAITIHKSQGLSLRTAIVDAGTACFGTGMIYVALSRLTSLEGLHLIDFNKQKLCANKACICKYNRLRELYTPQLERLPIEGNRKRTSDETSVSEDKRQRTRQPSADSANTGGRSRNEHRTKKKKKRSGRKPRVCRGKRCRTVWSRRVHTGQTVIQRSVDRRRNSAVCLQQFQSIPSSRNAKSYVRCEAGCSATSTETPTTRIPECASGSWSDFDRRSWRQLSVQSLESSDYKKCGSARIDQAVCREPHDRSTYWRAASTSVFATWSSLRRRTSSHGTLRCMGHGPRDCSSSTSVQLLDSLLFAIRRRQ